MPRPATGNTALRTRLASILLEWRVPCRVGMVPGSVPAGSDGAVPPVGGGRSNGSCWTRMRLLDQLVDAVGPGVGRRGQQILDGRRGARHQRLDRKRMAGRRLEVGLPPAAGERGNAGNHENPLGPHPLPSSGSPFNALAASACAFSDHRRRPRCSPPASRSARAARPANEAARLRPRASASRACIAIIRARPRRRPMFSDPTASADPGRLQGQAGAGEPVGDLVRAVRQGVADARQAAPRSGAIDVARGQPGYRARIPPWWPS